MKCFFQLISQETGVRSPAFGCVRSEAAAVLLRWCVQNSGSADNHYVLVLTDDFVEDQWNFSTAPLMTVRTFIEKFSGDEK